MVILGPKMKALEAEDNTTRHLLRRAPEALHQAREYQVPVVGDTVGRIENGDL